MPRRSKARARLIHTAITGAGLGVGALWRTYQLLGGTITELEVDAYLQHALDLPPRHRGTAAPRQPRTGGQPTRTRQPHPLQP